MMTPLNHVCFSVSSWTGRDQREPQGQFGSAVRRDAFQERRKEPEECGQQIGKPHSQ